MNPNPKPDQTHEASSTSPSSGDSTSELPVPAENPGGNSSTSPATSSSESPNSTNLPTSTPPVVIPKIVLHQKAAPASAVVAPSGGSKGKIASLLFVVVGLGGGLFLSPLLPWSKPKSDNANQATREHQRPQYELPDPSEPITILMVDERLRAGRYEEAVAYARAGLRQGGGSHREALKYREALALEGLGEWNEAIESYAELCLHGEWTPAVAASQLGQVRCLVEKKQMEDASRILGRLILASGYPALQERPYLAEVHRLRAQVECAALPELPTVSVFDITAPALPRKQYAPESFLTWADRLLEGDDDEEDPGSPLDSQQRDIVVHTSAGPLEDRTISVTEPRQSILELLKEIVKTADGRLYASPEVESRISGIAVHVAVARLPLADLLTALTEPHGIAFRIDGDSITLSTRSTEKNPDEAYSRARFALRRALVAGPDHSLAKALQVDLGSLDFRQGRLSEAVEIFDQVLRSAPNSPESLHAAYNLGLVRLRQGQFADARSALMEVVDRAPTAKWTSAAWWWIGRSYLDANQPDKAIKPLQQAMKSARGDKVAPLYVLATATAYHLCGEFQEAHAVLRDNREGLKSDPFRSYAAVVDTWARLKQARSEQRRYSSESEDLLDSLTVAGNTSVVGPAGVFLLGEAYRDLRMTRYTANLYEKALDDFRGPLGIRMTYDLGMIYLSEGNTSEARTRFLAVAAVDGRDFGAQARLQLAELALKAENAQEALSFARQVPTMAPARRSEALRIMGRAFVLQGDHDRAIACFSGKMP